MESQYGRMYNPNTVETISGNVIDIEKMTPMKGMDFGLHLILKTDNKQISVHLGPAGFVENQEMKIEPNDRITVKGSRVTSNGNPTIIAAEVMKGSKVLKLRDERGVPVWSGGRRRQ
jgi:hypothetical protein